MKALSSQATDLLARLTRPPTWRERVGGRTGDDVRGLSELAGLAEPALVPHLVALVFDGPAPVRRAAAVALDRALAAATAPDLLQLDEACRRRGWAAPAPWESGWRTLAPGRLAKLEALGPAARAALLVAGLHANGYVREAAVAELDRWTAAHGDGRELGVLLLRMNEWVQPVADRARAAVERRVTAAYAPAWLRALPLLLRLGAQTRRAAGALTERVLSLLRAPEQREALLAALAFDEPAPRRVALQRIREAGWAANERVEVVARVLGDADPVVRLYGVAFARERLSDAELEAVLPRVLSDPHPAVRQRALEAAVDRPGVSAEPWLERALVDRGAGVRELARFALRRLGWSVPFATVYRRELRPEQPARALVAAANGLAETGDAGDVATLAELLHHPRPSVRAAVVRALGRLGAAETIALRLARLADPSPRVTRAAREGLREQAVAVGANALRHAVRDMPHAHGRLDALALASHLSKWESLVLLLEAAGAADAVVGTSARARIAIWLARANQSFVRPNGEQLGALGRALGDHGGSLEEPERRTLRQLLTYWRAD